MSESNFARVRRRCSGGQVEGEARVSKQRSAAVRRPGRGRDFRVRGSARPQTKKKVPTVSRRSVEAEARKKPGSGGLQVACFGP